MCMTLRVHVYIVPGAHLWTHNSVCISASSCGVAACVSVYSTHCTCVYILTYALAT